MSEIKISNLQDALGTFLANEDANKLAPILMEVLGAGTVSYERAGEILRSVFPPRHRMTGLNCYQRACIAARQGDPAKAIELLHRALDTDWASDILFTDPDLDSLRGDPEFTKILSDMRRRLDD